jgi:stage III sporulation protein AB
MIIKIILSIAIVAICTYLGFCKSRTYEIREKELKKIQSALSFFKSKIEFTYEPIQEIFTQISKSIYLHKDNIFLTTTQYMENLDVNTSWNNAVEENYNFNKEDKEILKMFGKLLGKTDKKGQLSEIEITQNFIEKQTKKAEEEKNKNSKLYKTIGIIVGLAIVIILF